MSSRVIFYQLTRCTSVWIQDIADAPPALAVNPTTYPLSGLEYFILNENSRYMGMSQAHQEALQWRLLFRMPLQTLGCACLHLHSDVSPGLPKR